MKLLDLHISGFGKFHDRDITFADGLNIIYGKNEAGKSTLHTFIRCMLFGLERGRGRASKNDCYSRHVPWDGKNIYGGRMRVEQEGTIYRIERNFQKEQKSLVIINETLGKEVEPTRAFLNQLLCGLSETAYQNTISIGQLKSATDGGMVSELKNYIANMNTSGSMALNITKATAHLRSRRKELERQLVPEAARTYASLLSEVRNIEKEISAPEYENLLLAYQQKRTEVRSQLAQKQEEREKLLQKIAAGRQVLAGAQFTDEESILRYQEETCRIFSEYQQKKNASEKKPLTALSIISLVLSAILGAAAFFCQRMNGGNPLTPLLNMPPTYLFYGCLAGCVIFCCAAALLYREKKLLQKDVSSSTKILQEIFSRHLGDSAVSGEALQAFQGRMEEFVRLHQTLVRSQDAAQQKSAEIAELQQQETNCDDSISKQQRSQWELEKKLDHLTHCKDQIESLKRIISENDRVWEEIAAIDLALDTMTELSSTIRDSFGLHLNKTASDMIAGITGGIYNSMSVDENLNVFMNTPTKLVPVDQVSSGTMDQIYLALRLASARLIQSDHDKMPLIFDDSFVLYDDDRLRSALKWLLYTYDGQIIIFTCHQREAQMLTANQIPYHFIEI